MNNTANVYIKIDDNEGNLTDEQIRLDKFDDVEYTMPYEDDYSDIMNVGGIIDAGDEFTDR